MQQRLGVVVLTVLALVGGCGVEEEDTPACRSLDAEPVAVVAGGPFQLALECDANHVTGLTWQVVLDRATNPFPPSMSATATLAGDRLTLVGTVAADAAGDHVATVVASDPAAQIYEPLVTERWTVAAAVAP